MAERIPAKGGLFLPDVVASLRWDGGNKTATVSAPRTASVTADNRSDVVTLVLDRVRPILLSTIAGQLQIPVYELTDEHLRSLAANAIAGCSTEVRLHADGSLTIDSEGVEQGAVGRSAFASALAAAILAAS